ncbi:MAG: MFS transporter [Clostridia bacterium]|nr:MFS transporter [Clostridia bacterium]
MKVTRTNKLVYGVGAFGYGTVNQTLNNFLMFFGTGVLGLSGTSMGLAIALSTVWDAVTDPLVGAMSDNYRGRFGKRHTFMLVGCLAVAGLNLMIWQINPAWSELTKFLVLLVGLLLIETFNTVYSTPYAALGFDMCQTYHARTSIQSYKTVFQSAALLVPSVLMGVVLHPKAVATMHTAAGGYHVIAAITSTLCVVTALITIVGTFRFRHTGGIVVAGSKPKGSFFAAFFAILDNRNRVFLITAYAIALSCSAFLTTLGMHVFTYTFHFTTWQISLVLGCLVAGVIGGQPLWCWVSNRLGKKRTVQTALWVVLCGVAAFAMLLTARLHLTVGIVLMLLALDIFMIAVGVGCIYSLPISMFADNIALENTAMATGFLTFCTKCTNALVTFIVGLLLDLIGFQSGVATQTWQVSTALGWVLVGGVTVAGLGAWLLFGKYQDQAGESKATNGTAVVKTLARFD